MLKICKYSLTYIDLLQTYDKIIGGFYEKINVECG